jgi:quercetin dioxygenase-like cupin family protein
VAGCCFSRKGERRCHIRPNPGWKLALRGKGKEREQMMRQAILLVTVAVTVLALVVGAALATPPKGTTPTPLTRATLGNFEAHNDGIEVESERRSADAAIVKVVIEPGGSTGWHHHPGVALVAIKSGTVTEYDVKCEKSVLTAGEGFVESHDEVHLVRNHGNGKAVLYVTFIVPTITPPEGLLVDDPRPKGCNAR